MNPRNPLLPLLIALLAASALAEPPAPPMQTGRGLAPCPPDEVPATLVKTKEAVTLGIAARDHDPERPPEGWCGETAIQEAMLYHGVYYPQKAIHAAGRPQHPDLWSNDVPVALEALGMAVTAWPDGNRRPDLDGFLGWVRARIDAGVPVLCGVKINPTQHPEWGLDHFVLAVGHKGGVLVLNTTWGNRVARTEKQLRSTTEPGFAFENRSRSYYGLAVAGPRTRAEGDATVRLFVEKETEGRLSVVLKCEGLQAGGQYAVYRLASHDEKEGAPLAVFTARAAEAGFRDTLAKAAPAVYRCRKAPSPRKREAR